MNAPCLPRRRCLALAAAALPLPMPLWGQAVGAAVPLTRPIPSSGERLPVVGLGSFLAQIFLRRPLMEAATQEFQIDGSWYDPIITKVDRKARAKAQAGENTSETR